MPRPADKTQHETQHEALNQAQQQAQNTRSQRGMDGTMVLMRT